MLELDLLDSQAKILTHAIQVCKDMDTYLGGDVDFRGLLEGHEKTLRKVTDLILDVHRLICKEIGLKQVQGRNKAHKCSTTALDVKDQTVKKNVILLDEATELLESLQSILKIVNDSEGVTGYHLNGAIAKWEEFTEIKNAERLINKVLVG